MASRIFCSGPMTRRLTAIMAPKVKASAEASSVSCKESERWAAEWRVEECSRARSDADRSAKASHRDRAPLVRRQFSLLSGDQRIQQTIAQSEIFRFEIGGFGRGYRAGERRRE